ncbi:MAG: acetyltransferase, family [Myxococcaceae bacterium]|nr:acetyltransferase, family [Myxococcaceae bacterium]
MKLRVYRLSLGAAVSSKLVTRMQRLSGPAYRIETERTSLRCLEPRHAASMSAAIEQSLAHLRPWMSWTLHEPLGFEQRVERMRTNRGHFDLGSDYIYGIFAKDERELYGVMALKQSTTVDERELGYWLHVAHVGKGLAYEAGLAAVRVGFELEALDAIEIRTDPENLRSARIAERLGFAGPLVDPLSHAAPDGARRDTHVYSLARVQYVLSPAKRCNIAAYDVLDRPLI